MDIGFQVNLGLFWAHLPTTTKPQLQAPKGAFFMEKRMKSRPILFNAPMVRALLAGTKTQTRRALRVQFSAGAEPAEMSATNERGHQISGHSGIWWDDTECNPERAIRCPYGQPGDQLWVREAFIQGLPCIDEVPDEFDEDGNEKPIHTWYRATEKPSFYWIGDDGWPSESVPWKPSIHMPRAASRITLEITGVRVERLQDISEADARAEGAPPLDPHWPIPADGRGTHASGFRSLWEQINGPDSWKANPWVWAINFKRV